MCIDALEIRFQTRGALGHQRDNINTGVAADSRFINVDDVREALSNSGYMVSERFSGRGGRTYILFNVLNADGTETGITINSKNDSRNGREHYAYVYSIKANPARFPRWQDFWSIIEAMDAGGRNRIISRGEIYRIDYACDYLEPFENIMRGLYVGRMQNLFSYSDFDSYQEHQWGTGGLFSSFRINQGNKVYKIYDKRREMEKRLSRLESRVANNQPDAEDDYDDDMDDIDGPETIIPQSLETLRAEMRRLGNGPRTRIEFSVKTASVIRQFWGEGWQPRLSVLPDHLAAIVDGRFSPFHGVLLHHVELRGAHFEQRALEARNIRHEIEMGLLLTVYKRMGRSFWQAHRRFFELYPWHLWAQPTAIFQRHLRAWMGQDGLVSLGATIPPDRRKNRRSRPLRDRWHMPLSYCNDRRINPQDYS